MADINSTAKQFVDFYTSTFAKDRKQLKSLYRNDSILTWESVPITGADNIAEKQVSLPMKSVQFHVQTLVAQPTFDNNLFVSALGLMSIDNSPNPLQYSQSFLLRPEGASYYIRNEVFNLIYGS